MLYSEGRLGHSIRLTLAGLCALLVSARPLARLLPPAPLRTRPASSTGGDPPAIRHINRRTRPEVCLYLPSCRRTHPAPCIRSLLALTRLLCGLPKPCCPPTGSCRSSPQHAWPAHELQFCVLFRRPIPTPGLLLPGCSFFLGRLALSSGTCRRIHNDTNLNTTTPTYAHRPAAPACRDPSQRPPCAPQHIKSVRQLRASS